MPVSQSPLLSSPQNIAINPQNGDLLVVNGATNNELLEVNPMNGQVVAMRNLYTGSGGALFGLAVTTNGMGQLQVYYDNSTTNTLNVLHAPNSAYASYAFARANGELSSFGMTGDGAPNFAANGVVGYAPDPSMPGAGWEVTSSGVVIPFGGAPSYGSIQTLGIAHLFAPIVGIAPTPDGQGYWLVGADGGVFTFGDAGFYGNTYTDGLTGLGGARPLFAPIVGIAPTPDGQGYWLVGADGGVFTFGDAGFYGNTYTDGLTGLGGARPLAKPILSIVPTPDGMGYWLLAADGGVFDFGNAQFWSSGPAFGNTGPFTAAGPVSY